MGFLKEDQGSFILDLRYKLAHKGQKCTENGNIAKGVNMERRQKWEKGEW